MTTAVVVLISAFAGFQIGSIVEYLKKYNFADLELDTYKSLNTDLHNLVTGLVGHVKDLLPKS